MCNHMKFHVLLLLQNLHFFPIVVISLLNTTKVQYINITVAQDGSGDVKTIVEAIGMAPENSQFPYIILVKAGNYMEQNLTVEYSKTNLWFVGEGRGRTVISGNKSVHDKGIDTMTSATFAAFSDGLVLEDITFVNDAGPGNEQAVALLVGADRAVIYRCEIKGYQDTLYALQGRQFYRECDIYGTVDFIFGDAAAVLQNCTLWVRNPMDGQENCITAQGRRSNEEKLPTGISIDSCQIRADSELEPVKSTVNTFLGRPWKIYATVVVLNSYLGDLIDPAGWLAWNATSPVRYLYFGEYQNYGPGANTSRRVQWPGSHPNMSTEEVQKFSVVQFIQGQTWINITGVPYNSN